MFDFESLVPQGDYFKFERRWERQQAENARRAAEESQRRLQEAQQRSAAALAASRQQSAAQLAAAKAAADKQAAEAARLAAERRAGFEASTTAVRRSLNILSAPQATASAQTTRAATKPGTRRTNVRAKPQLGRTVVTRGGSGLNIST